MGLAWFQVSLTPGVFDGAKGLRDCAFIFDTHLIFGSGILAAHPLFVTLKKLKGNARGCVYTEPLWGIPFNLYAPYISVYMVALGLNDAQIGLIVSIGLAFQIVAALFSGVITDKLGRRKTTLIFDTISWSGAVLIWTISQNFNYFLVAAVINSMWRITMNSWTCLLVEDTDPALLVDIYAWIYISGLVAAFFAPIAGLLIGIFSLVPTMRGLYLLALIMMTAKFILTNLYTTETKVGLTRIGETKHQPVLSVLVEYKDLFRQLLKTPATLYLMGIMLISGITNTINNTFWAIYVTQRLQIPAQFISIYPFVRSMLMLVFFFVVLPRIRSLPFKKPMLIGILGFMASQVVLILVPEKSIGLLLISTVLEACGMAVLNPQIDKLMVLSVDSKERARINSILYMVVIIALTPFGWIGGSLSELNRTYPFMLNIALFAIGAVLVFFAARSAEAKARSDALESAASLS
jgi:MFS family permease